MVVFQAWTLRRCFPVGRVANQINRLFGFVKLRGDILRGIISLRLSPWISWSDVASESSGAWNILPLWCLSWLPILGAGERRGGWNGTSDEPSTWMEALGSIHPGHRKTDTYKHVMPFQDA